MCFNQQFTNYKGLIQLLKKMEREIEFNSEPPVFQEIYRLHYILIKNQYEIYKALAGLDEGETEIEEVESPKLEAGGSKTTLPFSDEKSTDSSKQTIRSGRRQSLKSQQSAQSQRMSLSLEEKDYYSYFGS